MAERGYSATKDQLQTRLSRIEGQVRGVKGMVDDDRYCIDVLTQVASVTKALQGVAMGLLDEHMRHCVAGAIASGDATAAAATIGLRRPATARGIAATL